MRVAARLALPVTLLVALPAGAHAPPQASGVFDAEGTNGIGSRWVRTNRGLISSPRDGAAARLLCNEAYGASLSEVPPLVATPSGLLLASYDGGLLRVASDGCSVDTLSTPLADRHVVALARSPSGGRVFALTSPSESRPGAVMVSDDGGATWNTQSETSAFGTALVVAPANPERVYVSAQRETESGDPEHELLVSSDGARSFVSRPLVLLANEVRSYVVGVDPVDADRVFLRTLAAQSDQPERLLQSSNAGATFSEIYAAVGPLAFAMDEKTAWLGGRDGLYRSLDGGASFEAVPRSPTRIGCLSARDGVVSACGYAGNEFGVFGTSASQSSLCAELRFADVNEQVACSSGSAVISSCEASFEHWQRELATEAPQNPAEAVPRCSASEPAGTAATNSGARPEPSCSLRGPTKGPTPLFWLLALGLLRRRTH